MHVCTCVCVCVSLSLALFIRCSVGLSAGCMCTHVLLSDVYLYTLCALVTLYIEVLPFVYTFSFICSCLICVYK